MAFLPLVLLACFVGKGRVGADHIPDSYSSAAAEDDDHWLLPSLAYLDFGYQGAVGTFTIIDGQQVIITAARTLNRLGKWIEPEYITILLGKNAIGDSEGERLSAASYGVFDLEVEPWSNTGIAVIFPDRKITLSKWVSPAVLAAEMPDQKSECRVYGFGTMAVRGSGWKRGTASSLMDIVDRDKCTMETFDPRAMLCAINQQIGLIPFEDDAGLPLMCQANHHSNPITVGILTMEAKAGQRVLGIISVPSMVQWITKNVKYMRDNPGKNIYILPRLNTDVIADSMDE